MSVIMDSVCVSTRLFHVDLAGKFSLRRSVQEFVVSLLLCLVGSPTSRIPL